MEPKRVRRQNITGFNPVRPILAFFCFLYKCQNNMVLVGKSLIPSNRVVQRPIKTFGLFPICSTVVRIGIRSFCRRKITVIEKLKTRRNIELISDIERQFYFSIEDSIQCSIPFFQLNVLLLKIPVFFISTVILIHQGVLCIVSVFVFQHGVWTVFHKTTLIHADFTIRTILKVYICTHFKPIGNFCI